jgi:hypothetical protein
MISLCGWIRRAEKPSAAILNPNPSGGPGLCGLMETTSYADTVAVTGGSDLPCAPTENTAAPNKASKM